MMTLAALVLAVASPAFADTTCPAGPVLTTADTVTLLTTAAGDSIPYGDLTLQAVEPEEIDLASACAPTVTIRGLRLLGVEPADIDLASLGEVDLGVLYGEISAGAHIVLGRQADPSGRMMDVETTGTLVLSPLSGSLREEVTSWRPYATVVVADVTFALVDVTPDAALDAVDGIVLSATSFTGPGLELMPDTPICGHCKSDIAGGDN